MNPFLTSVSYTTFYFQVPQFSNNNPCTGGVWFCDYVRNDYVYGIVVLKNKNEILHSHLYVTLIPKVEDNIWTV